MTETRQQVHDHISRYPGIHFNQFVRELDMPPGQIQYHIYQLLDKNIVRKQLYGRTHYYPPDYADWERSLLAMFHRETPREVLVYLIEHGPTTPQQLVTDLSIPRSTLEWHLNHLVDQDIIKKNRESRNRVVLELARPEETITLLRKAAPTMIEIFTDRFIRMVDHFLDGPNNESMQR